MTMRRRRTMPPLARAIGRRLLYGIPVLFIVTFGAAALSVFMPGSPAQAILGDGATTQSIAALNQRDGWDEPIVEQYWDWLSRAVHGDLGVSVINGEHIASLLIQRLAVTGELALLALALALAAAIPIALIASYHRDGLVDRVAHTISSALLSVPQFVSVVLLALVFTAWLGWLPATGWVPLTHSVVD